MREYVKFYPDHCSTADRYQLRKVVLVARHHRLSCTDRFRKQLAACQPGIDLIICDEGHRLKSKDNKTTKMFDSLRTVRRIRTFLPWASADNSLIWYSRTERFGRILGNGQLHISFHGPP